MFRSEVLTPVLQPRLRVVTVFEFSIVFCWEILIGKIDWEIFLFRLKFNKVHKTTLSKSSERYFASEALGEKRHYSREATISSTSILTANSVYIVKFSDFK